jgi:sterol desaturase/sphingolipid hydroxylase (fatty acid hydroxylase superfamily)
VVQIAMPPLLALLVVLGLSDLTGPHSALAHHWPARAGVLMVLLVDLMRYWVHRLAHTNPTLWRLHAVHHSPDKLYWLNTARFHPLEKALHFCFDSMPFILLGVNEYVLAFYFVCYAVNGFYQHSNVHLRFGLLNYLSALLNCRWLTRKSWRKPTTTTATPPSSGTSCSAPITARTTTGWNGQASRTTAIRCASASS